MDKPGTLVQNKCRRINTNPVPNKSSNQRRISIHTEVNDNAAIPGSSSRHRKLFNTLGVLIFVLGTGTAGLIYWNAHQSRARGSSAVDGSWQDGTLAPLDSKSSSRDIELYNGKVGVLAVRLRDWFEQPGSLAIILATSSTLAALACFLFADW